MKLSARCLLPALATIGLALPAQAAPAMWEVSDNDSSIKLFGSFHILPKGVEWRTDLFNATIAEADTVVFETDISPAAAARVGADAFARGIYTDGTLLTDIIDHDMEAQLREALAQVGLPAGSAMAMRPWMVANTISVTALAQQGFDTQGVEFVLEAEVSAGRMRFLESGTQQIDVLSGAPEDEQLAMLRSTLDELPLLPKMMNKMLRNWVSGTPENLANLFEMEMGGYEEAFMDRLLYERNRNWIAPLEQMLADNENALVVVGAAHLVGEGNVLELLEDAGYTVTRIQ